MIKYTGIVSISDSCDFSAGIKIFKCMLLFELPGVEYLLSPALCTVSVVPSDESLHGYPAQAKGGSLGVATQQWLVSCSHKFASTDSAHYFPAHGGVSHPSESSLSYQRQNDPLVSVTDLLT